MNTNLNVVTSTISSGSYLVTSGTGNVSWSTTNKTIEFIEFAFELIGIDLKYEDFIKLSDSERKALLRDFKISKILD